MASIGLTARNNAACIDHCDTYMKRRAEGSVGVGQSLGECSDDLCGDVEEEDGGDEGEGEDDDDEWVAEGQWDYRERDEGKDRVGIAFGDVGM